MARMTPARRLSAAVGTALLMTAGLATAPAMASQVAAAVPAGGMSSSPSISADGRFVAFESGADDLVAGDTNERDDIFVRDSQTGLIKRISVNSAGEQADDGSFSAQISANGRFVAFGSHATNLVAGDTNNREDIFLHDTQTGVTTRVNVGTDGRQDSQGSGAASISADGRYVAFQSVGSYLVSGDTNYLQDVFVRDTQLGTTTRVSVSNTGAQAGDRSYQAKISANGRYVAFVSDATNLVSGDTNNETDAFLRDLTAKTTVRVNVSTAGKQADDTMFSFGVFGAPAISPDGRYVAFSTFAANLVSNDGNSELDVFVRDVTGKTTTLVSVSTAGGQGNNSSSEPAFAGSGRYIAFESGASTLVSGDTNNAGDIFLRDTTAKTTMRVSLSTTGAQGNDYSNRPVLSADARYVAFDSGAGNLVAGDTAGYTDVFVRDRQSSTTTMISTAP